VKRTEASLCLEAALVEVFGVCQAEFKFCPDRKFRADFAVCLERLLLEINGGAFTQGRHTRGTGYVRDMEKRNLGTILGWSWLEFTPEQCENGNAKETLIAWKVAHAGKH